MSAKELRAEIQGYKKSIELANMVSQLEVHKGFSELILGNLFKERVTELVRKMSLHAKDSVEFANVVRELDSISYLEGYLNQVKQAGETAEDLLREARHALDSQEET